MFKNRATNQSIVFSKVGTPMNMPSGHELTNGDSVQLKYEQYDIDVISIKIENCEKISGVVDSISSENNDDIFEINEDIKLENDIEFKESNIFCCTRLS